MVSGSKWLRSHPGADRLWYGTTVLMQSSWLWGGDRYSRPKLDKNSNIRILIKKMTLLPQATRSHLNDTSHILCRSITSRRLISSSASLCQARERIRSVASDSLLRRPCLRKDNPYLPATYLIGVHPDGVSLQDTSRYPIRIPRAAVDPKLLKSAPVPRPSHQAMDPHPGELINKLNIYIYSPLQEKWLT